MSALDKMLKRVGKTREDFAKSTKMGKIFRKRGVLRSAELTRIERLPRRRWEEYVSLEKELTDWLKKPGGKQTLRAVQAAALSDLHDFGGLFAPIRVGAGKTLCSLLAAEVVEAKRPVLIVPAKLKRKTIAEIENYAKHWRFKPPEIVTYEWLGRVQADDVVDKDDNIVLPGYLREKAPDLIIADECHKLKNVGAAITRRVGRYIEERNCSGDRVKFLAMSGTITKRSIKDYAHIVEWCLGRNAPVPLVWQVLNEWADALDGGVEGMQRLAPGALLLLCDQREIEEVKENPDNIRKAYRRRLVETPGVISTKEGFVECSLSITGIEQPLNKKVEDALAVLQSEWEMPDGQPIPDPVAFWRHARELVCGFFYRWDPPAPKWWLDPRREWYKFVRGAIRKSKMDSELQVTNAVAQGRIEDPPSVRTDPLTGKIVGGTIYANWVSVRDAFVPNKVAVWLDDAPLHFCANWMRKNEGVVWVEHVEFGQQLAKLTKRPFFHRKGEDEQKNLIDFTKPKDGSIIASLLSNAEGRNLQAWNTHLMVSPPPTGSVWEQFLGRSHRDGQEADEVSVEVFMGSRAQWEAFQQAREDAKYIEQSTGQIQKLLYADVDVLTLSEVEKRVGPRWSNVRMKDDEE